MTNHRISFLLVVVWLFVPSGLVAQSSSPDPAIVETPTTTAPLSKKQAAPDDQNLPKTDDSADKADLLLHPWEVGQSIGVDDWILKEVRRDETRLIIVELSSKREKPIKLRIFRRDDAAKSYCRTSSFNIADASPSSMTGKSSDSQNRAMKAVCDQIEKNDDGQVQLHLNKKDETRSDAEEKLDVSHNQLLVALFALILLMWWIITSESWSRRFSRIQQALEAHPYRIALTAILVPAFLLRAFLIGTPIDNPALITQIMDNAKGWDQILVGVNERPPLYDAILHLFTLLSLSEWWIRVPGILFQLGSAVLLFQLLNPRIGALRAWLATFALLLSAALLEHFLLPGHVSLLMLLTLWSITAFLLCLEHPSRSHLFDLFMANLFLMLTSYAGILLLVAQLITLVTTGRSRHLLKLWGLVLVFTAAGAFFLSTKEGASADATALFTDNMTSFLFPSGILKWCAIVLIVYGFLRWGISRIASPLFVLSLSFVLLGTCGLGVIVIATPATPVYLCALLPLCMAALVIGAMGAKPNPEPTPWKRAVTTGIFLFAMGGYAGDLYVYSADTQRLAEKADFFRAAALIEEEGSLPYVVIRSSELSSIVAYYIFDDPLALLLNCDKPTGTYTQCKGKDEYLIILFDEKIENEDWQSLIQTRLEHEVPRPYWFFLDNQALEKTNIQNYLSQACGHRKNWATPHLTLYLCPY